MAYEVLSNPDKRRLYDQAGEQGIKEGGSGGDPFGRGGRSRGPRRTKNLVHQLSVSLE